MDVNSTQDKLKEILGPDAGMSVPEGFFEAKFAAIQEALPPYKEAEVQPPLSKWHRLRPYVYLAAMFAGIWLMMQVFHRVSTPEHLSLDNIPAQVAQAVQSSDSQYDLTFMLGSDEDDYELESEVAASYENMEEFEKAFGYELAPTYADMPVSTSGS